MAGLSDEQRAILDFERQWWRYAGGKAVEIERQLGMTPVAYYRALNTLLEGFATADRLRTLGGITVRPESVTPELVLQRLPHGEEAVAELRRLAEELLRHALGDARAPSNETLDRQSEALAGALARVGEVDGRAAGAGGPGARPLHHRRHGAVGAGRQHRRRYGRGLTHGRF